MSLLRGDLLEEQELLTMRKGNMKMTKKYFIGAVMGVGFGVLAAFVSAETGTRLADSSHHQKVSKITTSSPIKPLQSLGMGHPYKERREVSIDWGRAVSEAVDLLYDRNHKDRSPGELIQMFADSLRTILDLFEDRYDVRVVWKRADKNRPDVTDSFLEYAGNLQRLKDMCPLFRVAEYTNTYPKNSVDQPKVDDNKHKEKISQ